MEAIAQAPITSPVVTSTNTSISTTGGKSSNTVILIAFGVTIAALGVAGYIIYLHQTEKLTAEAKFNRQIKFVKPETV